VLLDRSLGHEERLGDPLVGLPFGHRSEHVALAWRQQVKRIARPPTAQHPADDLGVERAAPRRNAGNGLHERVDVANPFFEQIPDAFRALADQVQRVALLVVLRQDEHADLRMRAPDLDRSHQAVVAAARRHLDVGHDDVGAVRQHLAEQVVGVAGLRDGLEAGVGEQADDPFAHQHVVLADDHPHRLRHDPTVVRSGAWRDPHLSLMRPSPPRGSAEASASRPGAPLPTRRAT
jgi:hypothetical protein